MTGRQAVLAVAVFLAGCEARPGVQPSTQPATGLQPEVTAMTIENTPDYPRLVRLADRQAMDRINGLLAEMEAEERQWRAECLERLKEMKLQPDADTFSKTLEVTLLSPRYLSVKVTIGSSCGGAYPNVSVQPRTFNLVTGERLDWETALQPGVAEDPKGLSALYRAAYATQADRADDEECKDVVRDMSDDTTLILWLDRTRGLMIEPDLPHVVQACADTIGFGAMAVAPYVRDAGLLEELAALK